MKSTLLFEKNEFVILYQRFFIKCFVEENNDKKLMLQFFHDCMRHNSTPILDLTELFFVT